MTKKAQALLLRAYPAIERVAAHLAYTYGVSHLEAADLAQIGALEACEALRKGIHPTGDKVRYLVGVARFAMLRYCGQDRTSITTPRKARGYYPAMVVLSLDEPLYPGEEVTLLERLADEEDESWGQDAYNAAYECYLDSLPV